jgi:hypothetical protein
MENVKEFKKKPQNALMGKVAKPYHEKSKDLMVGSVIVTRAGGDKESAKIQERYPTQQYSLAYAPRAISVNSNTYMLSYPLRCLFEKEDGYYVITSEQLDIIGTGLSKEEAEANFNEEFDYLYRRLNSLDENQLSDRMLRIKTTLNNFVKAVQ